MKTIVVSHPKTRLLSDILEIRVAEAVGILAMIWNYAKQSAKDGDLSSLTGRHLASMLGWPVKDGDRLYAALVDSGWLDAHPHRPGAYIIHDWLQHCEAYVIRDLVVAGRLPEKNPRAVSPSVLYRGDFAVQSTTEQDDSRHSPEKSGFPSPPPSPSPSRPASQDSPLSPPRGGRRRRDSSLTVQEPDLVAYATEIGLAARRFVDLFPNPTAKAGWSRAQLDALNADIAKRGWDITKFDGVMQRLVTSGGKYPTPTPREVFGEIKKQANRDYASRGGAA